MDLQRLRIVVGAFVLMGFTTSASAQQLANKGISIAVDGKGGTFQVSATGGKAVLSARGGGDRS